MSDAAAALGALGPTSHSKTFRVDALWGDDPATLAAIEQAWRRGVSSRQIAETLSTVTEHSISDAALGNWCVKRFGRR